MSETKAGDALGRVGIDRNATPGRRRRPVWKRWWASLSSKATGRLEWLGVHQGQRVAEGEVIARLENRDVDASRQQAAAAVKAAEAKLAQGEAELADAAVSQKRARELAQKEFVSGAAVDTA